jgi:hypothetical protein
MARCAHCGKFILGGKKEGPLRFCNDRCYEQGFLTAVADQAAPEVVTARLAQVHGGVCPICHGEGPVDVCTSHTAWSIIVMTSWQDHPQLSCARCGKKAILRGLVITSVLGWWGFPFGLVVTPWQLMNGIRSLRKLPNSETPSAELQQMIKLQVAREIQSGQLSTRAVSA